MSFVSTKKQSSKVVIGAVFIVLGTEIPATAAAVTFSPAPLFEVVNQYNTTIAANGDLADVYFPTPKDSNPSTDLFPTTLLLQGALVDKSDYSSFASTVASYGFVVVVPNHVRTLVGPMDQPVTGLLAEQQQVNDVLAHMRAENLNQSSPLFGQLDPSKLGLLGHSFGGAVGLNAIQGNCSPPLCFGEFTRPAELLGGAFYGTTFRDPQRGGAIPPINNDGIPIALVAGSRDGVAELAAVEETYDQIQEPPKAFVTVLGANHYGITNEDNLFRDPSRPALDQALATETIARWSALFLRAHVLNDAGAFDYVYNTGDALDRNARAISQPVPEPASTFGVFAFSILGAGAVLKRSLNRNLRVTVASYKTQKFK